MAMREYRCEVVFRADTDVEAIQIAGEIASTARQSVAVKLSGDGVVEITEDGVVII